MQKDKLKEIISFKNAIVVFALILMVAIFYVAAPLRKSGDQAQNDGQNNATQVKDDGSGTFVWTGKAGDGKWSSAANWDVNRVPGKPSQVVFDSTSEGKADVDDGFGEEIGSLRIEGYAGNITLSKSLKISGDFLLDSGKFISNSDLEVGGDFTQKDPGSFVAMMGDTKVSGDFEIGDGFELDYEGAAVYLNDGDDWKMLTLNEDGRAGYFAKKQADAAIDTWYFYNASNALESYISQEKGWTIKVGDWDWRYLYSGLKRGDQEPLVAENAGISAEEDTVSINRGHGIEEWYENDFRGIEQGFTVNEKVEGEGELVLEGQLNTKNLAIGEKDEKEITFVSGGYTVMTYGDLSVVDADGKKLQAKLSIENISADAYMLKITIDDAGAKYPIVIDPISTTPYWTGRIDVASAGYGKVGTPAGDVNGDGRDDFLVGASMYTNGQTNEGKAFIYYGKDTGVSTTPAWSYESNSTYAHLGFSGSAAGDVNNDGYDDIVLGADGDNTYSGKLYLFLGGPTGLALTPNWTYAGTQLNQNLGQSISDAGDINGDGYDDIIAGAHYFDKVPGTITNSGRAMVFYGTSTGLSTSPVWTYDGAACNDLVGFSVSTAGDVNKDGYSDVLVGAPTYGASDEGAAYLFYGSASGLPAAPSKTFSLASTSSYFGNPVSGGLDINSDGYQDVLIGASRFDGTYSNTGKIFAYYGSATGLPSSPSWEYIGTQQDAAYLGSAWKPAGDVNGDGYDDVVAGSCGWNSFEGKAYVFLGSSTGLGSTPYWSKTSGMADSYMGWYADTAGDVNGDGSDDFLVSAYKYDDAVTGGRSWLFAGELNSSAKPEICSGGVDEDLDGKIDLADPDCDTSIDKSNITINVSTTDQNDWYDDICNRDTDSDGLKEYDKYNMDPACGTVEPGDDDLYYYQVCDSVLSSYDSDAAKKSYINDPFIGDEDYFPCSRDGVHDDYYATDAISPLLVQPTDKDFTIDVSASDAFGISSIKIEWTNATTYSVTETDWHNSTSGSFTCTGSANCNICIKGGDCGAGHDVIDYASLGIPDGLKQQKFFFRVTVVDNAAIPNTITTGYDENTAILPVLDKYYRLVICSKECHTCVNQKPTVTLDKYVAPANYCNGLNYTLDWNFSDPDGDIQAFYEVQIRDKNDLTLPVLSAVRASSDTQLVIFPGLLSGGDLQYNKTYEWRARAYDSSTEEGCQAVSDWTVWSPVGVYFTTPTYQYPSPSFTMATSSSDCSVSCPFFETINFNSTSGVYAPGTTNYTWYIDDMATAYATGSATTAMFTDAAQPVHNVKLVVTDGVGQSCSLTRTLNLLPKNPVWNEVAPVQD